MLRWISVILLLAALAVQSFSRMLIVAEYYTNTAAFAKKCENKTRPQLRCEGRCQMMKKLQEAEKKNGASSEHKADAQDGVISSKSFFAQLPAPAKPTPNHRVRYLSDGLLPGKATEIFHPPLLF